MPWRDPETLKFFLKAEVMAPVLAFITAVVRSVYDRKESKWQRILLDGIFSALIAVGVTAALRAIGIGSADAQLAVGAFIGGAGVGFVRDIVITKVRKKVDEM